MIGGQGGSLDVLALQRDDELLDALGDRRTVTSEDPAAPLLQAFAADVDQDLAELFAALDAADRRLASDRRAETVGITADRLGGRRLRLTAAATAALVLGGTLSVSGVAAAVTGDPFAPYRAVGKALSFGHDDLPPHAAEVAHLNKRLAGARAALAHGEIDQVRDLLATLEAELAGSDLSPAQRAAFERRLAALAAAVARAGASSAEHGRDDARASPTPGPRDGKQAKDDEAGTVVMDGATTSGDRDGSPSAGSSDGSGTEGDDGGDDTERSREGNGTRSGGNESRPTSEQTRRTAPTASPDDGTATADDGDQQLTGDAGDQPVDDTAGLPDALLAQKAAGAAAERTGGAAARR